MEFPSHFLSEDEAQTILRIGRDNPSEVGQNSGQGDGGTTERMIQSDMREKTPFTRTAFQQEDIDEIAENYLQALPAEMIPTNFARMSESEFDLPKDFHGPSGLQKGLKELVWEFRDRFRSSVSEEPARVEEFSLEVNKEIWELRENQQCPRRMDQTREKECRRQIEILTQLGIIQQSRAAFYSHALMVPKANGKWRFCMDFRKLNLATAKEGWPIPNIQLMLNRIGEKKTEVLCGP